MSQPSKLSAGLRLIGVAALCGAGVAFLVQGWSEQSTIGRTLAWAALTLALASFGVFAVRRLGDAVGARVALALAAATIPVHFAEIGAAWWSFRQEGTGSVGGILGAALVLLPLAPALALGAAALVGRRAAALTGCLFVLCSALLLPTRDGDQIAALAIGELSLLVALEFAVWRRDVRFATPEGAFARALSVVPVVILLVRNADYAPTRLWLAAVLLLPAVVAFVLPDLARLPARAGLGSKLLGGAGVCAALLAALPNALWAHLVVSVVLALGGLSRSRHGALFGVAGVGSFGVLALASLFQADLGYALAVVPAAALHGAVAFRRRSAWLTLAAPLLGLVGLGGQVAAHVYWRAPSGWMVAAAIGVGCLVVASVIESRRRQLSRLWAVLNGPLAGGPAAGVGKAEVSS